MTKEQFDKELIAAAKKAMEKCVADPTCYVGTTALEAYRDSSYATSCYHFEFNYSSKTRAEVTVSYKVPDEANTAYRSAGVQEFYSISLVCRNEKNGYHYLNTRPVTNKSNPELLAAAKDLFDYAASKYPEMEERSRMEELPAEVALANTKLMADVNYIIDTLAAQ